ncbi:MAG: hypothetical protein KKH93_00690 [Candidatus Omnitrophica bacterium]|nr:hypothetical protein [Candidatus Omnitrophota bacterium]MBU2044899.1 hypothetical protein [Candidatus Omnitrophota bacterium]MBU2265890.1 hypothetical protein [Candidatus Omnitrophota bacterium]MBU2473859.1 hypothetical protein [Candidatus Omnitrophota bacterium]
MVQENQIKQIIELSVKECGAQLVDLKISSAGSKFIRGLVDYPQGGITLGVCSRINKRIVNDLTTSGFNVEDYTVEINSPGLDRLLKGYQDFLRVKGRKVLLWLNEPLEGRTHLEAELTDLNPEKLVLLFKDETLEIPFSNIKTGKEKIQ